jgi:dihydrofolate reductase
LVDPFDDSSTMSRELILRMSMSVDGFVSGPNGEIDWMLPTMSDAGRQWLLEAFDRVDLIALGHRSYPGMAAFWSTATNVLARPMNEIPKAVFSRSGAITTPTALKEATEADPASLERWMNPIVSGTDLVADIQRMKAEDGKAIMAIGGASFASSLVAANLVDQYLLSVHPVVLGRGVPLFAGVETPLHLKLEDLKQFDTGAVAKIYRPA